MNIPFVDLSAQYLSIKQEIDKAINDILENTSFIGGNIVTQFEDSFAKFIGVKNCISCANGTDAIEILLKAMNIGQGDEVIVPAYSWISTSEAVSSVGATPVFVDIEKDFYCIDPKLIEKKITTKTKAIIPVHFYGQPADMPNIMKIAEKYNLLVLEDCAQAHGAEINNKKVGSWGNAASFSFYPGKNLGAYGDAGAMLTNDDEIANKARRITNHGQLTKHEHMIEGRNSRMDTLQAKILSVKLPYLEKWTNERIENAKLYIDLLKSSDITTPKIRDNCKHVFHLFVVQTSNRDTLRNKLSATNIQTSIHYPKALPFLDCYKNNGYQISEFPVSFEFQKNILSLPMFAELSKHQIEYITSNINE